MSHLRDAFDQRIPPEIAGVPSRDWREPFAMPDLPPPKSFSELSRAIHENWKEWIVNKVFVEDS